MMLIELYAPKGALTDDLRRRLAERLLHEVAYQEGAPAAAIAAGRRLFQIMIIEPETWVAGGHPLEPGEPTRYLARLTFPQGMLTDETRNEFISRVTRVLAEFDDAPERLYREPHAWVHLVEVTEGGFGSLGRSIPSPELYEMMLGPDGQGPTPGSPLAESASGSNA